MKYFVAMLILLAGAAVYIRTQEPHLWNSTLMSWRVPEGRAAVEGSDASSDTANEPSEPRPVPSQPIIISPDSKTYINPNHVHPVEQPGGTVYPDSAPPPQTPATNATNATNATVVPAYNPAATRMTGDSRHTIPSTITTLSGVTYKGCVFSSSAPDGITFLDSNGGAKVKFIDLDASFGVVFG